MPIDHQLLPGASNGDFTPAASTPKPNYRTLNEEHSRARDMEILVPKRNQPSEDPKNKPGDGGGPDGLELTPDQSPKPKRNSDMDILVNPEKRRQVEQEVETARAQNLSLKRGLSL